MRCALTCVLLSDFLALVVLSPPLIYFNVVMCSSISSGCLVALAALCLFVGSGAVMSYTWVRQNITLVWEFCTLPHWLVDHMSEPLFILFSLLFLNS